jgi:hypothetical protein
MMLFWDTSAILAGVFLEAQSPLAREAAAATSCGYAWDWLKVEAECALARRRATSAQWAALAALLGPFRFDHVTDRDQAAIGERNRNWRLRAADAGHLFCFTRVAAVIPDLQLVTFDDEMLAVARRLQLAVWPPTPPPREKGKAVREQAGVYRARRKRAPRKQP